MLETYINKFLGKDQIDKLIHPTKEIISAAKIAESVFCSNKLSLNVHHRQPGRA